MSSDYIIDYVQNEGLAIRTVEATESPSANSNSVITATTDGDLAVRTVVATESSTANSSDYVTATTDGKLAIRVVGSGGGSAPVIDELNVTPSTSAQTITAPEGTDGYSPVKVSAVTSSIDANITAENIKKDVQILGVTGSYEGTPEIYRVFRNDNGTLKNSITTPFIPLPSSVTDISNYMLARCYSGTPSSVLSGAIDLSSLTTISGKYGCFYMFNGCSGITSVDLSSLTTVSGDSGCYYMFNGCSSITSVDLSSLTTVSGNSGCYSMFRGCSGITSVDLSSLTTVSVENGCYGMFQDCSALTSVDLSSLTTISGDSGCIFMFYGCSGIISADLSSLTTISGSGSCSKMFNGCTSLATVYIGGTTAIDFGIQTNQFQNMFASCSQNIDVYAPAANQAKIESFSGYPNFGGTGTVTWHWRS